MIQLDLSNYNSLDNGIQEHFDEQHSNFLKKLGIGTGRRKEAKAQGLTGKDKRDYVKKLKQEDKGLTSKELREKAKERRAKWKASKHGDLTDENYEEDEEVTEEEVSEEDEETTTGKKGSKKKSKSSYRTSEEEDDDYGSGEKKILGMERKTGMIVLGGAALLVVGLGIFAIIKLTKK